MLLSRNDIKANALKFVKEWENGTNEDSEAISVWDSFFRIFGVDRRRLAAFEVQVKKLESPRMEFLFNLYDKYTTGLFSQKKP